MYKLFRVFVSGCFWGFLFSLLLTSDSLYASTHCCQKRTQGGTPFCGNENAELCRERGGVWAPGQICDLVAGVCKPCPPPPPPPPGHISYWEGDFNRFKLVTAGTGCGGRQFVIHNYRKGVFALPPPQLIQVDGAGNVIRTLHTQRVTNDSLIKKAVDYFSNWAGAINDTVVIWAFGKLPLVGSFPDTFCYTAGQIYAATQDIFHAGPDSVEVATWYGTDTLSIPTSDQLDFAWLFLLPGPSQIISLSQWGLLLLATLLLATAAWTIHRKRKFSTSATLTLIISTFIIAFHLSNFLK